jgi:predicted regulator of Ras-like GTPase activity (Roadblock/LC7/MglB family)
MFKEKLQTMLERAEGSVGALIMGTDGIAVEKILRDEGQNLNLDVAAAEFTSLVRWTHRTGADVGLGGLRELVVALERLTLVIRLVGDEYFLILALAPEGNVGRARFEMRKAELELAKDFTF